MNRKTALSLIFFISVTFGQDQHRSVQNAMDEWQDYTKFQKHELLSFCDFLIKEEFHERALLSLFQYLYRYPGDSLEAAIYYYIAQSYEFSGNTDLANLYYNRVQQMTDSTDLVFEAAEYRKMFIMLEGGKNDEILDKTTFSVDPYDLTFRGYAFMNKLQWKEARQSLLAAEEKFGHPHYTKLLSPLYDAIDAATNVPLHNTWLTFFSSLIPGGGQAYLTEWETAAGLAVSTFFISTIVTSAEMHMSGNIYFENTHQHVVALSAGIITSGNDFIDQKGYTLPAQINLKKNNSKIIFPPLFIGSGLYFGSIWKTWLDVDSANQKKIEKYVGKVFKQYPIGRFMDFPEPELINQ